MGFIPYARVHITIQQIYMNTHTYTIYNVDNDDDDDDNVDNVDNVENVNNVDDIYFELNI